MATGNLSLAPSKRGLSAGRLTGGENLSLLFSPSVGALRKYAGGIFLASDLGGYAAVVATSLTEGGF
mgnify:CR=1 FL=1